MDGATEDMHDLLSDSSFVILGESSLVSDINAVTCDSVNSQIFLNQNSSAANGNVNSWGSEPSSSEIQIKLNHLVKENNLLKETLNQSNLAMKNQFDTLVLWQQEVVKTHESHKKKFFETQEQIMKLKSENSILRKQMEASLKSNDGSQNVNTENENFIYSIDNLKKQIEDLGVKCGESCSDNEKLEETLRNIELEKNSQMREENFEAKKKLQELLEENDKLKQIIADMKIQLKSKTEIGNNISGFAKTLSDLVNDESTAIHQSTLLTKSQNEKSIGEESLSPDVSLIDFVSEKIRSLDVSKSSISELETENAALKKELEREREMSQINIGKMVELEKQNKSVQEAYEGLQDQIMKYSRNIEELEKCLKSLNSELIRKTLCLKHKNEEIVEVKEELQKRMLQWEEIAILRLQVEQYESDYMEQKNATLLAVSEKEEIGARLQNLEREYLNFKKSVENNADKGPASSEATDDNFEPDQESNTYTCFNCGKMFQQFREIQEHVEDCLKLNQ